ncbi:DUF6119 family protein [Chryseobacterium gambrini]|uniref:TIGR04141 family sporadically distributed protein n=1 Tax=Chryseobacterium gambrini TaxID=373672 RepID=A0ABM8K3A3_9FLAO|nr:TIGR04141 family sporadically distributed protein [Chryseobacterium gambrini]
MSKFNIYKIPKVNQEDLIQKFNSVGLHQISSKYIRNFHLDFFLSSNPELIDIWWTEYYSDFFDENEIPQNKIYFGCLIIYNDELCYVISLGKTHFYLKEFSDLEFGINLAERIIDINNLKLKNSKFYKSKRNKSIVSFSENTSLDYDSGESLHFVKAKTIDQNLWGNTASFGHSVQLSMDITIQELPTLIERIESKLSEDPVTNFPKAELIKDQSEIDRLDILIAEGIRDYDSNVGNDEFDLSGVDFIFTSNAVFVFKLKGTNIESENFMELSMDDLREFLELNNIDIVDKLNRIQVKFIRDEGRNLTKSLKSILQYVTDDRETLIDSKWYKFNQSYVNLLNEKVDKIQFNYFPDFDYPTRIIEDTFNDDRVSDGYLNLHTSMVTIARRYTVENMDLYKDDTLFFVKKGGPKELNYAIDQATNIIKLLKNNESKIQNNGEDLNVTTINIWGLIERVTNISKVSDFRSLIFIMKMNELYREATDAGLSLNFNINYINRP